MINHHIADFDPDLQTNNKSTLVWFDALVYDNEVRSMRFSFSDLYNCYHHDPPRALEEIERLHAMTDEECEVQYPSRKKRKNHRSPSRPRHFDY
jgi:hypothetical protein